MLFAFACLKITVIKAQSINPLKYTTDGEVRDLAHFGDTLIIAGDFMHTGIYTGGIAKVTATSDQADPNFPRIESIASNEISSIAADGNGGYFFLSRSGIIQHILANNTLDVNFSISVSTSNWMNQIAYANNTLYVGLVFANAQGSHFEAYNAITQQPVAGIPVVNNQITRFRVHNGSLYLVGSFDTVGTMPRMHVAAISTATNTVEPWVPQYPPLYSDPGINDISFYGGSAILSGSFWKLTGTGSAFIYKCAVVDTATGAFNRFLLPEAGLFAGDLNAIYWAASASCATVSGSKLYVFTNGTFDTRITAVELNADTVIWARFFNMIATVRDMAVIGNTLFAAGSIDRAYITDSTNNSGYQNIELQDAKDAVAFDKITGSLVNWHPNPVNKLSSDVNSLIADGNNIIIGGDFSHLNGINRQYVCVYKTQTDEILPFTIDAAALGTVNNIFLDGSTLYTAGDYDTASGANHHVTCRAYDLNTGTPFPWYPAFMGEATAMAVNSQYVFIAGNITDTSTGTPHKKLLAIDKSTGKVVNWYPEPDDVVRTLHIADNKLYVGGQFSNISGSPRSGLATYDLSNLSLLNWQSAVSGDIKSLTSNDSLVFVGGNIPAVSGNPTDNLVAIRKSDGSIAKRSVFHTQTLNVAKVILKSETVFMGGFTYDTCTNPAIYKGDTLLARTQDLCINVKDQFGLSNIYALDIIGDDLYFGGAFFKTNNSLMGSNIGRVSFPSWYFTAPTGIADLSESALFTLYPNPTHDQVSIKTTSGDPYCLRIFDQLGRSLYSSGDNRSNTTIDVHALPAGIYYLSISSETTTQTKTFIKQ